MDQWIEICRRVLTGEVSKRYGCREYGLHWQTLQRVLDQLVTPEWRQAGPARPSKLDRFRPVIETILDTDRQTHRKQRHAAWRISQC